MKVFVFPGQGSQKKGMGGDLFDAVPQFREWEPEVDAILGRSLRTLCLEDPDQLLNQTQFTQPCLYTVNALHYLDHCAKTGESATAVAGHSLGEFNALYAAGAYSFLDGFRLVQRRGQLMSAAQGGGMAAVVGVSVPRIESILKEYALNDLTVANRNSPTQVVLSGDRAQLHQAQELMKAAGCRLYSILPVSAAFHSPHMDEAARAFGDDLKTIEFAELDRLVMANRTALPYPSNGPTDVFRTLLTEQMIHPVLWTDSVRYLLEHGATEFLEMGPGKVLTRLIRQIKKG